MRTPLKIPMAIKAPQIPPAIRTPSFRGSPFSREKDLSIPIGHRLITAPGHRRGEIRIVKAQLAAIKTALVQDVAP